MADNLVPIQTDAERQALKTEYQRALADMQTIQNTLNPTNAQVIWAIRRLAVIQEKILKFMARNVNG